MAQGLTKFNRNYIIEIEGASGEIHQFKMPLTLELFIKRNALASANTATFRIYNLNKQTRDDIYHDNYDVQHPKSVKLLAGYGDNLTQIFFGNIKQSLSYRDSGQVNYITEVSAYDFSDVIVNTVSNWNLSGNTDTPYLQKNTVINKLVSELQGAGVQVGKVATFTGTYPRGRTIMGSTWDALQTETENSTYIDNGKLYCLPASDAYQGDITILNTENGLLSTPKKADQILSVEILFEPRLSIGQEIFLESESTNLFKGRYKIIGLEHAGIISGAMNGKLSTNVLLNYGNKEIELLG